MPKTVREWRIERQITQWDLAALAQVSTAVLSRMENGRPVQKTSFILVCRALSLPPEEVTGVKIHQSRVKIGDQRRT